MYSVSYLFPFVCLHLPRYAIDVRFCCLCLDFRRLTLLFAIPRMCNKMLLFPSTSSGFCRCVSSVRFVDYHDAITESRYRAVHNVEAFDAIMLWQIDDRCSAVWTSSNL